MLLPFTSVVATALFINAPNAALSSAARTPPAVMMADAKAPLGPIKLAGKGMKLIGPIFNAEAVVQAAVTNRATHSAQLPVHPVCSAPPTSLDCVCCR